MNSDLISQIKILPIDQIVPFEQLPPVDPDLSISDCHLVRDPFLVAPLDQSTYVLLDNTDTFAELISCGLTQVPVQVVGRNEVSLTCPRLGLSNLSYHDLVQFVSQLPNDVTCIDQEHVPADRSALTLRFEFADQPTLNLSLQCKSTGGCPESLRLLFALISTRGGYQPEVRFAGLTTSLMRRRNYSSLLTLSHPSFNDIEHAARLQQCYPLHTVLCSTAVRALQIDLSVAVLTSDLPLGEKEAYLRDLIAYRYQTSRTASYEGRVYLLNR